MADDHESAISAWLADATAQREIGILRTRFPSWKESDVYLFAIMLEILTALDFYGEPEIILRDKPDDEDDEPWRGDATGFTP